MTFDLIVVGAGVLGCFHAWAARQRGWRVLLLERSVAPQAASVRNFGLIIPTALTGVWQQHGLRGLQIYRDVAARVGVTLNQSGTLYVAQTGDELARLEAVLDRPAAAELGLELLDPRQALHQHPLLNPDFVRGALHAQLELRVQPREFLPAMLRWLGADDMLTYRPATQVVDVAERGGHVEVRTAAGERFDGQAVVVCCGAELATLFPERLQAARLNYCRLQMVRTEPLEPNPGQRPLCAIASPLCLRSYPAFQSDGIPPLPVPPEYQRQGVHVWLAFDFDGRIIAGDSHHFSEYAPMEQLESNVERLIVDYAAQMLNRPLPAVETRWCGVYVRSPDQGMTDIQVAPRIRLLTGLGGKGMTVGPSVAEQSVAQMAELVDA